MFAGFGQTCPDMPHVLQNNKLQISLEKVEVFCLFVACSDTSRKAAVLLCHFSWVWSGMPKVLRNNRSLSLSDFVDFLHVVIWAGIVRLKLSANQTVRFSKLKKLENYMRYQVDFLLPLKLQKISCYFVLCCKILFANQFAGFFTFDLLILIPGVHCYIVLVLVVFRDFVPRLSSTSVIEYFSYLFIL